MSTASAPEVQDHSTTPLRIAIVDDDTVLREGLPVLLPEMTVVIACRTVHELITRVPDTSAVDVVLLDLNLTTPGEGEPHHGRRGVETITKAGFTALIYTNERRRLVLAGCYLAGAKGIVHKTESMHQLREALLAVHAGRAVVTPAVAGLVDAITRAGKLPSLSERQAQVLHGRARGETYPAIGRRLYISPRTAEEYMAEVLAKFRALVEFSTPTELERILGLAPGDLME